MSDKNKCNTCDDTQCNGRQPKPDEDERDFQERQALEARMCGIKHKLVVLSGKGGVGKSTVAANLAAALSLAGKSVGLLDIDIHGPSIPKLLHLENSAVRSAEGVLHPVETTEGLKVMSLGFLFAERDDPVIWRGPIKHKFIKQMLKDVEWGELDYLVVDSPPGTGDEPLSIAQLIPNPDGAIIVTTPQQVAVQDVRRSIQFCRRLGVRIVGVVENMSGFSCPQCGLHMDIFGADGGKKMAEELNVPFLGAIPMDLEILHSGEDGRPFVHQHDHSRLSHSFLHIVRPILELDLAAGQTRAGRDGEGPMKVAIPVAAGMLSTHFGHCEKFAVFDVDPQNRTILSHEMLVPPAHEPGVLPRWLHEKNADVIITGGMGARAQSLFSQSGIEVIVGVHSGRPEEVVRAYLDGSLSTGPNVCDH